MDISLNFISKIRPMKLMIWGSFVVLRIDWFVKLAERCQFKDWLEEAAFGFLSKDMEIVLDGLQEGVDETQPWVVIYAPVEAKLKTLALRLQKLQIPHPPLNSGRWWYDYLPSLIAASNMSDIQMGRNVRENLMYGLSFNYPNESDMDR